MDVRETGLKGTHKSSDIEAAKKGREPSTLSVVARVLSKFLVSVFSFQIRECKSRQERLIPPFFL